MSGRPPVNYPCIPEWRARLPTELHPFFDRYFPRNCEHLDADVCAALYRLDVTVYASDQPVFAEYKADLLRAFHEITGRPIE